MKKHADSHFDHGLSSAQVDYLLATLADHRTGGVFVTTVELPVELGTVPCGLYGPTMGDPPVSDVEATLEVRGTRAWKSRLIDRPMRPTRSVTVVAGPHDGEPCIVYTMFGGPQAPQEPDDPGCKDVEGSRAFWRDHALAR